MVTFLLLGLIGTLGALTLTTTMASSKDQMVFGTDSGRDSISDELVRHDDLPSLADLLTLETRASIFYSYAREIDTSKRFSDTGDALTMFVPTNEAIMALGRKPHEDPNGSDIRLSNPAHDAISKSNVRRWVGVHIVPVPKVNFTSVKPYDTLTGGVAISFKPISDAYHPPGEPVIDTDSAHFASVKGNPRAAATVDFIVKDSSAEPVKDTDAAHFSSIKGHQSSSNSHSPEAVVGRPIWQKYLLNGHIHIIDEKKASNGMLYLIDGTVNV